MNNLVSRELGAASRPLRRQWMPLARSRLTESSTFPSVIGTPALATFLHPHRRELDLRPYRSRLAALQSRARLVGLILVHHRRRRGWRASLRSDGPARPADRNERAGKQRCILRGGGPAYRVGACHLHRHWFLCADGLDGRTDSRLWRAQAIWPAQREPRTGNRVRHHRRHRDHCRDLWARQHALRAEVPDPHGRPADDQGFIVLGPKFNAHYAAATTSSAGSGLRGLWRSQSPPRQRSVTDLS